MMMSLCASAQHVSVADYGNGEKFAVIDATPVSSEFQNVKIYLRKSKLKDFVEEVRKKEKKVSKWAEVAKKEQVTDMEKDISGSCYFAYMTVEYEGNSYWIEGAAMMEGSWLNRPIFSQNSQTGRPYCRSIFKIDKQGNCFLVLVGEMAEQTFKYGNIGSIAASSAVGVAADNNGNVAGGVGVATSKAITTITLQPNFNIYIPAAEINTFATQLEDLYDQLTNDSKEQKAKKKLFK